jgi:hypothetical protein
MASPATQSVDEAKSYSDEMAEIATLVEWLFGPPIESVYEKWCILLLEGIYLEFDSFLI